jgi:mRNA interferase RelE/StbE
VTYRVALSPAAAKHYRKRLPEVAARIRRGIDEIQHAPFDGPQIKRLRGQLRIYYRYRVGDYRIVYTVDRTTHRIYVDYIQHRRDIYRR